MNLMEKKTLLITALIGITVLIISGPIIWSTYFLKEDKMPFLIASPTPSSNQRNHYKSLLSQGEKLYHQALNLYQQGGKTENILFLLNQAIDKYHQAIRLQPNEAQAYYRVGQLYDSVKEFYPQAGNQAEVAYHLAYLKEKTNSAYLNSLAYFLWREHKFLEAKTYLENGLKNNPNNTDAALLLAKTYAQLGEVDQAITTLISAKSEVTPSDSLLLSEINKQLTLFQKLQQARQLVAAKTKKSKFSSPLPSLTPSFPPSASKEEMDFSHLPLKEAMRRNSFIIAEPKLETKTILHEEESNALVGKVTFPKGKDRITVLNQQVALNSKIITVTEDKTNQTIFVQSKKRGSFTLASPTPLDKDIVVSYWIVE